MCGSKIENNNKHFEFMYCLTALGCFEAGAFGIFVGGIDLC